MSQGGRSDRIRQKHISMHVSCAHLHGHQPVVDSLLFHQLAVSPQLYDFTLAETGNDVGVSDGGQAVSDDDGGATQSDLEMKFLLNIFF